MTATYPPRGLHDYDDELQLYIEAGTPLAYKVGSATSIGATTVTLNRNGVSLAAGMFVGVGAGSTGCEIRRITNVSGGTLTFDTALKVAHSVDENVWVLTSFWVSPEWWGARATDSTFDSYRSLINMCLDHRGDYGIAGRGTQGYYTSRPLFINDYRALTQVKLTAFYPFALDCLDGLWNTIPLQYLVTLAGQFGTATFDSTTDVVTLSGNPGSAQYSDLVFYPRPGSTMPGGIEEGKRYFTITGNSLTTQVSKAISDATPVNITSAGSGEIVWISSGLARLLVRTMILDGNNIKGLSGLYANVQQPSDVDGLRIENFPVVGATIGAQQGRFGNLMIFDCWTGLELAGAGHTYYPQGNIESCDINCDFVESARQPPGFGTPNWNITFDGGFHWESPGGGTAQVQTLTPTGTLTSGTFQLRFKNVLTSAINFDSTAAQLQAILEAHAGIGVGNVSCTQVSGINLSNGAIRMDFRVGSLKWERWEGSTNTIIGGQMTIENSTIAGGTLAIGHGSTDGRNIAFRRGVGVTFKSNLFAPRAPLGGDSYSPPFIKCEGLAVDTSSGQFQGFTLEDIIASESYASFVDDSLNGVTLSSADSTGAARFLRYYARGGRHAGGLGSHWYHSGDGGRMVKLNQRGAPQVEIAAASGQTDAGLGLTGGAFMDIDEASAAPAAPSANRARFYARDNGAGKTQIVVRFPTGAVQVIATEP